jgi:hypothetical protein
MKIKSFEAADIGVKVMHQLPRNAAPRLGFAKMLCQTLDVKELKGHNLERLWTYRHVAGTLGTASAADNDRLFLFLCARADATLGCGKARFA